jgi:hypothetical protein
MKRPDHFPSREQDRVTAASNGERLTRYLLGELPPEEAEAVEDECFRDDEAQAALEAADDDLVDAFVRGTLPPERQRAFEALYAASPPLRERVEFSRALLRTADERAASPAAASRRRTITWAVAAGLAAAAIGWVASDLRAVRREREAVRLAEAAREREATELQARLRAAAEELERSRARQQLLQELLAEVRSPLRIASFVLAAGTTRDLTGTVLHLPGDASVVRLHLLQDGPPPPPPLEATIETAEGDRVWRAGGLAFRPGARGAVVTLNVGAEQLPPGDYVATLSHVGRSGRLEEVASYSFRTER